MSLILPESMDAWRMVLARRSFVGELPVAALRRLCGVLAEQGGVVRYRLDFARGALDTAYMSVQAEALLSLICQRTLEPFAMPLVVGSRLGLIRSEREEAALPPGFEPLLVGDDGRLCPADIIEDELLLALPLIPVAPGSSLPDEVTGSGMEESEPGRCESPFAILRELKKTLD